VTIADDLLPLAKPIKKFKSLEGNPRRGDVEAVVKSYERFGQRKPIVALRDGTVIAGNHQLEAAKRLGWKEIAVVYVDDDDATAKAFSIADNRTHELGGYDPVELLAMLNEVAATDATLLDASSATDLLAELGRDQQAAEAAFAAFDWSRPAVPTPVEHHGTKTIEIQCPSCGVLFIAP